MSTASGTAPSDSFLAVCSDAGGDAPARTRSEELLGGPRGLYSSDHRRAVAGSSAAPILTPDFAGRLAHGGTDGTGGQRSPFESLRRTALERGDGEVLRAVCAFLPGRPDVC